VESEKTSRISQQVESDATLPSLDRIVSLEITPEVTRVGDHIANHDAQNGEDQGQAISDVQKSIAAGRAREIHVKPVGSLLT